MPTPRLSEALLSSGIMNSSEEQKQLELLSSLKDQGKESRSRRRPSAVQVRQAAGSRGEETPRVRLGAAAAAAGAATAVAASLLRKPFSDKQTDKSMAPTWSCSLPS